MKTDRILVCKGKLSKFYKSRLIPITIATHKNQTLITRSKTKRSFNTGKIINSLVKEKIQTEISKII